MTALKIADLQRDAYAEGREEGISIGLERGMEQGASKNKPETAKMLLSMGLSREQVAQGTGLPLETVRGLVAVGRQ